MKKYKIKADYKWTVYVVHIQEIYGMFYQTNKYNHG